MARGDILQQWNQHVEQWGHQIDVLALDLYDLRKLLYTTTILITGREWRPAGYSLAHAIESFGAVCFAQEPDRARAKQHMESVRGWVDQRIGLATGMVWVDSDMVDAPYAVGQV